MPAQQRDPATPCACRGPDSRTRVGDLERTASPVVVRGQDWSGRAAVGAWLTKPKPDYWMSDSQSRKTDGPCARPPVLEGAVALLGLCREKATQSPDWGRAVRYFGRLEYADPDLPAAADHAMGRNSLAPDCCDRQVWIVRWWHRATRSA